MKLIQRPYQGAHDQQHMLALVNADQQANFHLIDLPYRFSSWAFDNPDNIGLWEDEQGALVGWAVLQTPFWAIDYACHPQLGAEAHPQLLAWADQRARQLVGSPFGRPIWFINVFAHQNKRIADLEAAGFASQAHVAENPWSKVLLQQTVPLTDAQHELPAGFVLRPLAGLSEVPAYVDLHRAVFESESMTVAWRTRTLQQQAYQPDLDLVIVDPAGALAAFCICWFTPHGIDGRPSGQIEPMGVRADLRGQRLGQLILSEGVRRLYARGAEQVVVETDNYRDAAFALYESVGFRVREHVLVFRKDYA